MGFNFSNIFFPSGSKKTQNSYRPETVPETNASAKDAATKEAISHLEKGSSISGEVIRIDGKEIQLKLPNDVILQARLDWDMELVLGQQLSFEVKKNGAEQLALRPLYANMAMDPNVTKALEAASLPINEQSIGMVNSMMEGGLSIDSDSLQAMYRQILANPEAAGETIVEMNRLQIPVTPENLLSFGSYKNYEHQMTNAVDSVAESISQTCLDLIASGEEGKAVELMKQLLAMFAGDDIGMTTQSEENIKEVFVDEESVANASEKNASEAGTADTAVDVEALQDEGGSLQKRLASHLEQMGVPKDVAQAVRNGSMGTDEILKLIQEQMNQNEPEVAVAAKRLLLSREFQTVLKDEITKQWLLKPEEIRKEGKVDEFYKQLNEQTGKLTEELLKLTKEDSSLYKTVSSIKDNVNFMEQLNQTFSYVQLPLKMSGRNATGDLYVYTNKKSLAEKEGNVSALLHLDMENLGPVDVYVAMQEFSNVTTNFYLQDDSMLDFIEKHLHLLTERLEKKGYGVNANAMKRESLGETNVIDEILKAGTPGKANSVIAANSFDVRA